MTCLLQIVALLLFAYHASAQIRECPPMSFEVLQSTDNSRRSTLLVQTYNTNVDPTDPFIVVEEINIVCEAAASKRDTYRYASVVVRQICSGFACPEATRDISTVVQYDFECSISNQWIPEALGSTSIRDDDPKADLDTEPAERCAVCAMQAAGADPVTHCRGKRKCIATYIRRYTRKWNLKSGKRINCTNRSLNTISLLWQASFLLAKPHFTYHGM